jgi:hypothetical protein
LSDEWLEINTITLAAAGDIDKGERCMMRPAALHHVLTSLRTVKKTTGHS